MKKSFIITIFLMLVWGISVHAEPEAPVFNVNGGVYENTIEVTLTGEGDIYYTLNGDVPTTASAKYTEPFVIEPSNTTPPKGTTIRAAVIKDGETSYVSSNTYFVGKGIWDYVGNYPFVNLIATRYDLWDSSNGIYTNYNYEHKVPGVFHYITTEGQTEVNRTIEMKVSGNGSRSAAKKSLRVYFKKTDPTQSKFLEYDLIPSANVDYYSKVTFRISDWSSTNIRDPLAQKIAGMTRVDTAESVPMALFLNGEYWGLYECREQHDEDYLSSHYGIDKDNFVYLDRDWTQPTTYTQYEGITYTEKMEYAAGPEDGNKDGKLGESYYREQWTHIKHIVQNCDIASDEVYEEFCSLVDVDNFIDYLIVYIYSGNDDWPGNNFRIWRVTEEDIDPDVYGADGKWRFMVHDFDLAFENAGHNTLYMSTMQKDDDSAARHPKFATDFLQSLLKNESFRNELAQRAMVYLSTKMRGMRVSAMVDELAAEREAGKSADLTRWSLGNLQGWKNNLNNLKGFAGGRPANLKSQYKSVLNGYYNAGITGEVGVNVKYDTTCYINGAEVDESKELTLFSGIPVRVEAKGAFITVTQGENVTTGFELLSFYPTAGSVISVEKADTFIKSASVNNGKLTAEVRIGDSDNGNVKLYAAGYDDEDKVIFVKTTTASSVDMDVEEADYYRLFVWNNMKPVIESYKIIPTEGEEDETESKISASDGNDNLLKDIYDDNFDPESDTLM